MKSGSLIPILLLAAGAGSAAAQERIQTDWGVFTFERERGTTTGVMSGAPDSVYRAVRRAITDLGLTIKPADDDPRERHFLVRRHRLSGRLAKRPVSKFLSCGDGLTGPNADTWHVFLTIDTRVTARSETQSQLDMEIAAEAIDVPGGRSDRLLCTSTGNLETEIVKQLGGTR